MKFVLWFIEGGKRRFVYSNERYNLILVGNALAHRGDCSEIELYSNSGDTAGERLETFKTA